MSTPNPWHRADTVFVTSPLDKDGEALPNTRKYELRLAPNAEVARWMPGYLSAMSAGGTLGDDRIEAMQQHIAAALVSIDGVPMPAGYVLDVAAVDRLFTLVELCDLWGRWATTASRLTEAEGKS